jgi:WD40 repeat protein
MQKFLQFENPSVALWLLHRWRKKHTEAVLIVDRFEELFTLNGPEVQSRFADLISAAALESDVRVLISMRDDFLLRCHDYESLSPIFSELTPFSALAGPSLRRALVQPALKCGYRFEDEILVDEILGDLETDRGALPLMAFAAARLWEKRDRQNGQLTRQAYKDIGGVEGALAQHAETTMERIGSEKMPIVREIFCNLITAENTRVARDTEELLSIFERDPGGRASAEEVLRVLIDARLLTSYEAQASEGEKPRRRVEIIHESLLSAWPRLIRWQTQDENSAQLRDQLRQAAQLWEKKNRTEDLLWTGTAFQEYQNWRKEYKGGLTTTEDAFAQAMVRRANKQRNRKRITISTIFVVLLGIIAIISNFWHKASVARDEAISQARRAEAGRMLTAGKSLTTADPSTKLAYALASLELADLPEAHRFALQILSAGPPALMMDAGPVNSIEFSPNGKWIAAGVRGGLQLLSRDGSAPITVSKPYLPGKFIPWNAQFSADGEFLVWTMRKDTRVVKVWSMSQRKVIRTFNLDGTTICFVRGSSAFFITDATGSHDAPFLWSNAVVRKWNFDHAEPEVLVRIQLAKIWWQKFDIDNSGRWIAYTKDGSVYVTSLNASGRGSEKIIGSHDARVAYVKFRPNSEELASADINGIIRFWSLKGETKDPIRTFNANGELKSLWFDPDGKFFLAARDQQLLRWDLTAPNDADPIAFQFPESPHLVSFNKKDGWMAVGGDSRIAFFPLTHEYPYTFHGTGFSGSHDVRFTPDGKSFLDGLHDDKSGILRWNVPGEKRLLTRDFWNPNANVSAIDVDPLGKYVVAGLTYGKIHLISIADRKASPLIDSPEAYTWAVAFSKDGNYAAAAFEMGGIQIWDLKSQKLWVLEKSKGNSFCSLEYSPNGNLYAGDFDGNLYEWNPIHGSSKILKKGKGIVSGIAISRDGNYISVVTRSNKNWNDLTHATAELVVLNIKTGKSVPITSHGNRVLSVGFDSTGTTLVTGDIDGNVRVGPRTGENPHLLLGHQSGVSSIAVDPSGKWIVSAETSNPIVRLWPMPKGESLAALSLSDFLNRVRSLTNVRIVPDDKSSNGYRIQYASFSRWDKVPNW